MDDKIILKSAEICLFDNCTKQCPMFNFSDCKVRMFSKLLVMANRQRTDLEKLQKCIDNPAQCETNVIDDIVMDFLKDAVNLQKSYKMQVDLGQLTKRSACLLVMPFRDKYKLTSLQCLKIARKEMDLSEMVNMLEGKSRQWKTKE